MRGGKLSSTCSVGLASFRRGADVSLATALRAEGGSIAVYGDGSQTHSFCHVDDLVAGIMAMLDGTEPGPVNLGNPEEFTVNEFGRLVLEITGSASVVESRPVPVDDPTRHRPDIGLARSVLDWKPEISVSQCVRRTVDWFRSRPDELIGAGAPLLGADIRG